MTNDNKIMNKEGKYVWGDNGNARIPTKEYKDNFDAIFKGGIKKGEITCVSSGSNVGKSKLLNLYLVQDPGEGDYDTYDSFIACASSPEEASLIHPGWCRSGSWDGKAERFGDWCAATDVEVTLIGKAVEDMEAGPVLSSFNAG